jgi:hypothetical protein
MEGGPTAPGIVDISLSQHRQHLANALSALAEILRGTTGRRGCIAARVYEYVVSIP